MRNYQVLTLIGTILGMIIALGAYAALASIGAFHGAFDEFTYNYGDPSDVREFEETRQTVESETAYAGAAVAVVVIVDYCIDSSFCYDKG